MGTQGVVVSLPVAKKIYDAHLRKQLGFIGELPDAVIVLALMMANSEHVAIRLPRASCFHSESSPSRLPKKVLPPLLQPRDL